MCKVETDGYYRIKQTSLNFAQSMKLGDKPGRYEKETGGGDSFYGSYHAAHVLDLFGELDSLPPESLDQWADRFRIHQCDQGYFSPHEEDRSRTIPLDDMEPYWHYTRGHVWALRVLARRPERPLSFLEPLLDARELYRWVRRYDWSNAWAAGNQVLAAATALLAARDWFGVDQVDSALEHGMYPALEELVDPKTGFWGTQLGSDLPAGLFGTIHVLPIYYAQGWPTPAVERNVDSTLACQLADGSFWPGGSDCPDFDGAYMIANLAAITEYRREDLERAARQYLQHALLHEDPSGCGWLLHRRDSTPADWKPRPHFLWRSGSAEVDIEYRDDDPSRTHIMLGTWFYPLSIALIAEMLGDTGYEGPYQVNPMSLHQCNVFREMRKVSNV